MNFPAIPIDFDSLPVAVAEITILLISATVLGWVLAKVIIKRRIHNLQELIEEKKYELAQYRTLTNTTVDYPIATNASKTVYPTISPDHAPDDLKVIEGIGPKIEEILNKEGIHTFEQLTETSVLRMAGILKKAGPRFQLHDPSTWPQQANLAKQQKWEELERFKIKLISGNQ
jgi:predicted flap endonuclease-1-like 5' DNA nuclease